MDKREETEPGGESSQYESIKTVTQEPEKQQGQLGGASADDQNTTVSDERGERTAENIRYGQGISEGGFGGQTTTSEGEANQGGEYGRSAAAEEESKNTRREQKYGAMPNIGA